jgi:hypothetical protein
MFGTEEVTLTKLSDNKLSVCRGDKEICILPIREECILDILQRAFNSVVEDVVQEFESIKPEKDEGW